MYHLGVGLSELSHSLSPMNIDTDLQELEMGEPVHPSLVDNFKDKLVFIKPFPPGTAGRVMSADAVGSFGHYIQSVRAKEDNLYKLFSSQIE